MMFNRNRPVLKYGVVIPLLCLLVTGLLLGYQAVSPWPFAVIPIMARNTTKLSAVQQSPMKSMQTRKMNETKVPYTQRWMFENSRCQAGGRSCSLVPNISCGGGSITCSGTHTTCHGENIMCQGTNMECAVENTVYHADNITCHGNQITCHGDDIICQRKGESCVPEVNKALFLPLLYRDLFPDPQQYNIYLIDTSSVQKLEPRTICSLESYCQTNPDAVVWMLVTACQLDTHTTRILLALKSLYPHLRVASLDVELTLSPTPLHTLYNSEMFWETKFLPNNLSNLARYALVYRSGGLYSDTDVIAWKPVSNMSNFFAKEDLVLINTAVFHFDTGHPFLFHLMSNLVETFKGHAWASNGPYAVTRIFNQLNCSKQLETKRIIQEISQEEYTKYVSESRRHFKSLPENKISVENIFKNIIGESSASAIHTIDINSMGRCNNGAGSNPAPTPSATEPQPPTDRDPCDMTIMPNTSFYPISWVTWRTLFDPFKIFYRQGLGRDNRASLRDQIFSTSFGIHLSNHLSKSTSVPKGSLLSRVTEEVCPVTRADTVV